MRHLSDQRALPVFLRKLKLTDRNVRTLPAVNGRTDYTDELLRGFEQPGSLILGDWQRTAPDSTSLNNRDRVLEIKLVSSTQDPAKQPKHVGV